MSSIHLLLVEDDLTDQLGFKRFVKNQSLPYNYDISGSVSEAINALSLNSYDVVIADHALGDGTAFELFQYIPTETPVIFVTSNESANIAVKAIKAGASDYVAKDIEGHYLKLLPHIINAVLKSKADKVELEKHRNHLEKLVRQRTHELHEEIKQRKFVEQQLRLLAFTFESHEAIVITDNKANIIRVNKAFTELTGYSVNEAPGKNMRFLKSDIQTTEFYQQMWKQLLETGRYEGELWNRRKSGETYPEWLTITAILDDKGNVTNYVGNLADISKQKNAEIEIKKLAFYDPLTGLANRRLLLNRIDYECAIARRNKYFGSVIFIDLDNFKPLNDIYGHQAGDDLLIQVAKRLTSLLRQGDTAARLGGDEFIVLTHAYETTFKTAMENAKIVASKIQATLNAIYHLAQVNYQITSSIGISVYPDNSLESKSIINQADKAMYLSKSLGKNVISVYRTEEE